MEEGRASLGTTDFEVKQQTLLERFSEFLGKADVSLFPQEPQGSRYRCLFQLVGQPLRYARRHDGEAVDVQLPFEIASPVIQRLMPLLLVELSSNPTLAQGVRAVNFMTTLSGDALICLMYDAPLDEAAWLAAANIAKQNLHVNIMARAKKQCLAADKTYVTESLPLTENLSIQLRQHESVFSNPSPYMCLKTMEWLLQLAQKHGSSSMNLLELYSGACTYTSAMCQVFKSVHAVEIQHSLVEAANFNIRLNDCQDKVTVFRAPVRTCRKILYTRKLKDKEFHAVLLDPPRNGLDDYTRRMICSFDLVMLISCNPYHKLYLDAQVLKSTHTLVGFAVLDHFPGTTHLECAAAFVKRKDKGDGNESTHEES